MINKMVKHCGDSYDGEEWEMDSKGDKKAKRIERRIARKKGQKHS
jgi:hypothetical protein